VKIAEGIRPCGAYIFWSNISKNFSFGGPIPLSLHRWVTSSVPNFTPSVQPQNLPLINQNLRSRFGIERHPYTKSRIGQIPCVCMYVCMYRVGQKKWHQPLVQCNICTRGITLFGPPCMCVCVTPPKPLNRFA